MSVRADGLVRRLDHSGHASREYWAKTYTRFHLRSGGQYLHMSGLKLTDDRKQAWSGTAEQGRACRAKFDAAVGCKLVAIEVMP
jgi:hypothetical protein